MTCAPALTALFPASWPKGTTFVQQAVYWFGGT